MGMYDEIRCKARLPEPGFEDRVFQTKCTPAQCLDLYEISEDGTLLHQKYDIEDRSNPNATDPFERIVGCATRVNPMMEPCDMTGEIRFYDFIDGNDSWIEFSAYFISGKMQSVTTVRKTAPHISVGEG